MWFDVLLVIDFINSYLMEFHYMSHRINLIFLPFLLSETLNELDIKEVSVLFFITLLQYYQLYLDKTYMSMKISPKLTEVNETFLQSKCQTIKPEIEKDNSKIYSPNYFFYSYYCFHMMVLCSVQIVILWAFYLDIPNYRLIQVWLTVEYGDNILISFFEILIKNTMVYAEYYKFHFYFHCRRKRARIENVNIEVKGKFPRYYFKIEKTEDTFEHAQKLYNVLIIRECCRFIGLGLLFVSIMGIIISIHY